MIAYTKPLAYSSPYGWVFWAVFLFTYLPEYRLIARSKPSPGEKTDRGSMAWVMLTGSLGSLAAFVVAPWSRFTILAHRTAWFALGLGILLAGSLLRRYCFRTLGPYFTGNVRVQAQQPVIDYGPYRLVRHPSYAGGMLMYLGTGLALTNWLSAFIFVAAGALMYSYRVYVEEQALASSLGQPYLDYIRRTKRFIPFVF